MAIIINYAFGFATLYDNADEALVSAYDGISSPLPSFHRFSIVRAQFFTDYAYILSLTGPADPWGEEEGPPLPRPEGFNTRPLAVQLLALGNRWAHLYRRQRYGENLREIT